MIGKERIEMIAKGAEPTDAEIAEIVRTVASGCRTASQGDGIAIREGFVSEDWWKAFKAIFRDSRKVPERTASDYSSFLVFLGSPSDGEAVGFAHDDNDGLGMKVEGDEEIQVHPDLYTLVPVEGLRLDLCCDAREILGDGDDDEEEEEEEDEDIDIGDPDEYDLKLARMIMGIDGKEEE